MAEKAWNTRPAPAVAAVARTASHRQVRQRDTQPGLILAAAAAVGSLGWVHAAAMAPGAAAAAIRAELPPSTVLGTRLVVSGSNSW